LRRKAKGLSKSLFSADGIEKLRATYHLQGLENIEGDKCGEQKTGRKTILLPVF